MQRILYSCLLLTTEAGVDNQNICPFLGNAMNNDANLYERKYLNIAGELNSDMVNYWTDLIGKSGVSCIKKKWPSVLSDKCEYRSQISDFKYSKLKAYYASHEIIENEDIVKHYKNKNLGCFFMIF